MGLGSVTEVSLTPLTLETANSPCALVPGSPYPPGTGLCHAATCEEVVSSPTGQPQRGGRPSAAGCHWLSEPVARWPNRGRPWGPGVWPCANSAWKREPTLPPTGQSSKACGRVPECALHVSHHTRCAVWSARGSPSDTDQRDTSGPQGRAAEVASRAGVVGTWEPLAVPGGQG